MYIYMHSYLYIYGYIYIHIYIYTYVSAYIYIYRKARGHKILSWWGPGSQNLQASVISSYPKLSLRP